MCIRDSSRTAHKDETHEDETHPKYEAQGTRYDRKYQGRCRETLIITVALSLATPNK